VVTAVGLDLDGTLVDHSSAAAAAVLAWSTARGWPSQTAVAVWTDAERTHFGAYVNGHISFAEQRRRRLLDFLSAVDVEVDGHDLDQLFDEYLAHYRASWVAFPDALPFLVRLRAAGLNVAVLTNGRREQQLEKLTATGLRDAVDVLIASGDLPAGKPDHRAFSALCQALNTRPEDTAYIGDSLQTDVEGAAAAGLRAVWLDRANEGTPTSWPHVTTLDAAATLLGVPLSPLGTH